MNKMKVFTKKRSLIISGLSLLLLLSIPFFVNTFLNSEYSTGFSGYGNWRAINNNNLLNVFVAEGENNVIRIFRRKNGVNTSEDIPIFIPQNNTIELTYDF